MLYAVYRMTRTKEIDQAPGQKHLHLPVSHRVLCHVRFVLMMIEDVDLVATLNCLSYIGQAQDIPWRDPVPVVQIGEGQGKDAEVDQILPVNARKALVDDGVDPEIARGNGRMLAARSLTIIAPGDDERAGLLVSHRPLIIRRIDGTEHEFADGRNIAAVRQYLLTRRHDFVRRNMIPQLDQHRPFEAVG